MSLSTKAFAALLIATAGVCQDARQLLEEAQRRSRSTSQRYDGMLQTVNAAGKRSEKRWHYERLGSHGGSKAVVRFLAPAEVKGVAVLILNSRDRASGQWMWTPATARERRIATQNRGSRFFGTDFSFEDLEERDVDQFNSKLLGEVSLDGAACWQIECRPKPGKASQYTHSRLWLRKDNYVVARLENYRADELIRRIVSGDIQNVQGIWTPRRIEVSQPSRGTRTTLWLEKLEYNSPLDETDFTLQALRRE